MTARRFVRPLLVLLVALTMALTLAPATQAAPTGPAQDGSPLADPFFTYDGATPLADIEPGTVLKTRTVPYRLLGVALPIPARQILHRSEDALGRPSPT